MSRFFTLALAGAAFLGVQSGASAQVIIGGPGGPKLQPAQLEKLRAFQREMLKDKLDPNDFKEIEALEREMLKAFLDPELLKLLPLEPNGPKPFERELEMFKKFQELDVPRRNGLGGVTGQLDWAGMRLKNPTADDAKNLGLPENEGQQVVSVSPGSAAEKAGLKANDIIVKIDNQGVPSNHVAFAKLVKDHDAAKPMEIVVVRDGNEQKLQANAMPLNAQTIGSGLNGGIRMNDLFFRANPRPLPRGLNGAKIERKQDKDKFSGEYSRDDVTISVTGKIENGRAIVNEIAITEKGKDAKKFASINEVPRQYRMPVQILMPLPSVIAFPFPPPFEP